MIVQTKKELKKKAMERHDPPAFPANPPFKSGMSLRDYFAGQALMGWVSDPSFDAHCNYDVTAAHCYAIADAMLAERERKNG